MAIASKPSRVVSGPSVALLTLVFLGGSAVTAHGQYYYEPAPDYYRNDTAEGTLIGGALGAITGAIVGGKKNSGKGALIGGGVGAISGNLLGREKDNADQLRAASGAAFVAQANRQAAAQAVTNFDLIRLAQAGVGDDVIISTIRARGARFELSPDALIALKEQGVSDRVLIAAQELNHVPVQPPASATIVTQRAPSRVIIAPYPGWRYPCPPHYRHHYHPAARGHHRYR